MASGVGDPLKLIDTPRLEVWHRSDASYGVPRANFRANVLLPAANRDATASVLTEIYVDMVNEQLNEFSYAANLAGLGAGLRKTGRGVQLEMGGYADGQQQMLQQVVDAMLNLNPDTTVFNRITRRLREEIGNNAKDAPYQQTGARTYKLLFIPYFTDAERLRALQSITMDDVVAHSKQLFKQLKVVALSHGNLTAPQTLERIDILQQQLISQAQSAQVERLHMIQLPAGEIYTDELTLDHNDSSLSVYVQSLTRDRASRARYALLRQILSQPLYTELRTRQQLGYFVFTYSIDLIQVPSVVIALQSPNTGPGTLYRAVEDFLKDFESVLADMPDDAFEKHVQSVVSRVEEQDTRLRQRTGRYWSAIVREDYQFDASELFAAELNKITKADMLALYRQLFIEQENARLVVYASGANADGDAALPPEIPVGDLETFKQDKVLLAPLAGRE